MRGLASLVGEFLAYYAAQRAVGNELHKLGRGVMGVDPERKRVGLRSLVPWLLTIPLALPLCVPLYARNDPMIGDVPFFIWFQLPLVVLGIVVTGLVYWLREKEADPPA